MKLDSVRELKLALADTLTQPSSPRSTASARAVMGSSTQSIKTATAEEPLLIALGIAPRQGGDYRLAVRVQQRTVSSLRALELVEKRARGEVDVRFVGPVVKRSSTPSWHRQRNRPLRLGGSIGHHLVTAGTLGVFVRERRGGRLCVLSNNHVLADENRGKAGDAILQPGTFDRGRNPADAVATLAGFVRLKRRGANAADAALAALRDGIEYDPVTLTGLGKLTGLAEDLPDVNLLVAKVGRTTGLTRGRITAIELDRVRVDFDVGTLRFDGQIEVEGVDDDPFSDGGDSGSLVVDEDKRAVGLLFAGADRGGSNGQGLTYVNPLRVALDLLEAELTLSV